MSEDGGDDSPPRPKRKIKKVLIVSSASESDSDESVTVPGTRRKRLRVLSDEESSDSSGSSVVLAGTRRRRALPKLRDSEAESDGSGWATDTSTKPPTSTSKPTSGFASDSSEGNSDKCSICLLRFTDQETGTPENCEHIFCFDCITEWSKNVNTCPVDRITFNSIIVKACAGGRVLRTEEVKVAERRSSVDMLVFEDLTVCEICRRTDNEDTMLLCDGCDMGYHMHCLTPPLNQVPVDQWLCPNCDDLLEDVIHFSTQVEDLFSGTVNIPLGPRPSPLRAPRNVRRSARTSNSTDQPSTSSGRGGSNTAALEMPTTSRGSRNSRSSSKSNTRRRTSATQPRKRKRRKAKTIVIEYEIQENGKFPITKRVTKRLKKRKTKRQPRTAARRTHVRASVRAQLAALKSDQRVEIAQSASAGYGVQDLAARRYRAGISSLSLMGNPNHLDYFSDDENDISEATTTAVATRPTSNILSAYRQARRKMIAVPSPRHASSAPDLLSDILESQTLLHSKKSLVSISVDGNLNIKLQTKTKQQQSDTPVFKKEEKVDLTKASEESTRKAPTYPGQSRGGGGWGGGYRGNYPRDHGSNGNFGRGGNYENNYTGGYQNRQGNSFNNFQNNMRREEPDFFDNYSRRPHQFPQNEDSYLDRPRRAATADNNRGPSFGQHPPNFQRNNDQGQGRHSLNASWPNYGGAAPGPRHDAPAPPARHSFSGFENPVDMRVSQVAPMSAHANVDSFSQDKRQPPTFQSLPESQPYRPMTQPPIFNFPKVSEVEKSEDEKSDSGLVIDTEKYDPTEPTNDDDDSGDEEKAAAARTGPAPRAVAAALPPHESLPPPPAPPSMLPNQVQTILAGIDTSGMNVPHNILDDAVRQVLKEHQNLISSPSVTDTRNDKSDSDDDSDGDCPNFSIYSATSVHIANNTNITDDISKASNDEDNLEDLIQEDDEVFASDRPAAAPPVVEPIEKKVDAHKHKPSYNDTSLKKKSEEEYKEKVSKRCPITTNTRNPIKIKLNTPSLIKRQVSLYDEEEASQDVEEADNAEELRDDKAEDISRSQLNICIEKSTNDVHPNDESKQPTSASKSQFLDTFTEEPSETAEPSPNEEIIESKDVEDEKIKEEDDEQVDSIEDRTEKPLDNMITDRQTDKSPDGAPPDAKEHLDVDNDEVSNNDSRSSTESPKEDFESEKIMENMEKMTESISETEDERSYTPCLDENKSNKDASFDNDKDKGIEGLDTEMISEEEGNEMFSENEEEPSEASRPSPLRVAAAESEEGEILDKRKEGKKSEQREEGGKKKKKKDSKKEGKDKSKNKKKGGEISFKKLSKSGKERNYREREKDDKKSDRDRRGSGDAEARQKKRKEKRKDLERYDVRTVVTEKRRKLKDPFGRDVSPRGRSLSRSSHARSASPARRASPPARRSPSPSPSPPRRTPSSPARLRRSVSRPRGSPLRPRRSLSRIRRSHSRGRKSPSRIRRSPVRKSAPRRGSVARARSGRRRSASSPRVSPRRRSPARRKRRRSAGGSPPRRLTKKKKRARSAARRASATVVRRRSDTSPAPVGRPPSPRTPPSPTPHAEPSPLRRPSRPRRRPRDAPPPSKEVFTSGDNILVSVSFKEQERGEEGERRKRRDARRGRRKRKRVAAAETEAAKPVAIIDLERSPFRELTPSPKNVIVLSDSDHGEKEAAEPAAPPPEAAEAAPEVAPALGPQTPPEPAAAPPAAEPGVGGAETGSPGAGGSPDAYDPFEPTRSASASPARASPPSLTLEAAQRSNLSADEVLARRPLSPAEKVLALLQSQRAASPEPLPELREPREPRAEPPRPLPKLFPGKPSPIKSNPVKPMQAARLTRPPSDAGASPYSPGSSDFGELFEPPPRRVKPVRPHKKKGKTQVGIKIDEENFKILDDLPSSAVELQVKNKFLKKLNRQERVVEEVKLVLKPHYNRKRVSKDDYKEILRRCVPKICHNKTGEINPTKIQALVEAYVKKFRKKHKLGIV